MPNLNIHLKKNIIVNFNENRNQERTELKHFRMHIESVRRYPTKIMVIGMVIKESIIQSCAQASCVYFDHKYITTPLHAFAFVFNSYTDGIFEHG